MAHPTPEAAARGRVSERYAHVLGCAASPDGRHAVVLLGMNEPSDFYPYQVLCERAADGWAEGTSGNGAGWSSMGDDDPANPGVVTSWGEAPTNARAALVAFGGTDHEVPVSGGYYLFVAWDVPEADASDAPVVRRFIQRDRLR
jgi:hypothetical protein